MSIQPKIIKLLRESEVFLRPQIEFVRKLNSRYYETLECRGLLTPNNKIILAYECDNIPKTLLHEVLHKEEIINTLTEEYWSESVIRWRAQERIIKELGVYRL